MRGLTLLPLLLAGMAAAAPCPLDTTGDGVPELVLPEVGGVCVFPAGKRQLPGTLAFAPGTTVRFTGNTLVQADAVVVPAGATLQGTADALRALALTARAGDVVIDGTLDLALSDDLDLLARAGAVRLRGPVRVDAAEVVTLDARGGDVELAPAPAAGLAVRAGLGFVATSRTGAGGIRLDGARIGTRRATLKARLGPGGTSAGIALVGGAVLATDPAVTGLAYADGDVRLDASGPILLQDAVLDAARNVRMVTRGAADGLCLADGSLLQARHADGTPRTLVLDGVRGGLVSDGTATVDGLLRGGPIVVAPCP